MIDGTEVDPAVTLFVAAFDESFHFPMRKEGIPTHPFVHAQRLTQLSFFLAHVSGVVSIIER